MNEQDYPPLPAGVLFGSATYLLMKMWVNADRAQQSARHREELLAYEVTVGNLRAACDKYSEAALLAQPEQCWCDTHNIGKPGVSCGDCPTRDYKRPERSTHEQAQWTALENLPNKCKAAADNAMTDFELTRSVIYDCPALRLPQSFLDRLGMVAQIVVLKGATPEIAKFIVSACNAHTEALAAMKDAQ